MPSERASQVNRTALVIPCYSLGDPVTRNTVIDLQAQGFEVSVLERADPLPTADQLPGARVTYVRQGKGPAWARPLRTVLHWVRFRRALVEIFRRTRPQIVVTFMLHPLTFVPFKTRRHPYVLVACVYDIPSMRDTGWLDWFMIRAGWRRLREADVVWSSDVYKARLAQAQGSLSQAPFVCYNCPRTDYLPAPAWPRDGWLRAELRRQGAPLPDGEGGCVLLRSGAVGPGGGIEETIEALRELPDHCVFALLGRPTPSYREHLLKLVADLGLERRVFLWDRVTDEVWKKALLGADIGHLVHTPPLTGGALRAYQLNSSLSNYRLFQYMAAGLPIITYDDPRLEAIRAEVDCFRVLRLTHLRIDLRTILADLAANPAVRHTLGHNGWRAHQQTYNWKHQSDPVESGITDKLRAHLAALGRTNPPSPSEATSS